MPGQPLRGEGVGHTCSRGDARCWRCRVGTSICPGRTDAHGAGVPAGLRERKRRGRWRGRGGVVPPHQGLVGGDAWARGCMVCAWTRQRGGAGTSKRLGCVLGAGEGRGRGGLIVGWQGAWSRCPCKDGENEGIGSRCAKILPKVLALTCAAHVGIPPCACAYWRRPWSSSVTQQECWRQAVGFEGCDSRRGGRLALLSLLALLRPPPSQCPQDAIVVNVPHLPANSRLTLIALHLNSNSNSHRAGLCAERVQAQPPPVRCLHPSDPRRGGVVPAGQRRRAQAGHGRPGPGHRRVSREKERGPGGGAGARVCLQGRGRGPSAVGRGDLQRTWAS